MGKLSNDDKEFRLRELNKHYQDLMNISDNKYQDALKHSFVMALPLFDYVEGERQLTEHKRGCLITIRMDLGDVAYIDGKEQPELTELIKNDSRIPITLKEITKEKLIVFKEWQEKLINDYY